MIRPFQPSDLFLIQRLNRQATRFPTVQTLLEPHSALWTAFSANIPWGNARVATFVLRQDGHGLVQAGFLQVQMRQARPEADVLCLAPSLDAPSGHPAIWSKLLSHYLHEVIHQSIERIYADVPDQPLPVNIFAGCGFQPYCRQTVWRLHTPPDLDLSVPGTLAIRPQRSDDALGLLQLYTATVPKRVREAEGMLAGDDSLPPILENWPSKQNVMYVLAKAHCIVGAVQLTAGRQGTALRLWADTLQPDSRPIEELLHFALAAVKADRWPLPVFVAVSDYHGGMNAILSELGFAPFSDRVKMVKHVVKWVRESIAAPLPKIETAGEVVPSPFASPDAAKSSAHSSFTDSGHAL